MEVAAMKPSRSARLIALDRACLLAWGAWGFYTVACAWPQWGGPVPVWVYPAACLGYGLLARLTGSALCAGAAGACASAPLLRIACDDHGFFAGFGGMLVSALVCFLIVAKDPPREADGRMPAGQAATLLWLATTAAGPMGLLVADALARAVSLC
jgi:hypothetical protein